MIPGCLDKIYQYYVNCLFYYGLHILLHNLLSALVAGDDEVISSDPF